jgi:hypothetical protein
MPKSRHSTIVSCVIAFALSTVAAWAKSNSSVEDQIAKLEAQKQSIQTEIDKLKGSKDQAISGGKSTAKASAGATDYSDAAKAAHCTRDDIPCIALANDKEFNQNIYVRNSRLDAFYYLYPAELGSNGAKGANFTYSGDDLAGTKTLSIQAMVSYAFRHEFNDRSQDNSNPPLYVSAMAIAPFVFASGKLQNPQKKGESNALQFGLDTQFELAGGGIFSLQDVGVSPYYQTDFRGRGSMVGVDLLWEPYQIDWNLGGRLGQDAPKPVGFYWRTVGEADLKAVRRAGLSVFADDTNYAFLGGTLEGKAVLFENMPSVGPQLCGRVHLDSSYSYFWEAASGKAFRDFKAGISYDLSKTPSSAHCLAPDSNAPKGGGDASENGVTSIDFTYEDGTDKNTLERKKGYEVSLGFRY